MDDRGTDRISETGSTRKGPRCIKMVPRRCGCEGVQLRNWMNPERSSTVCPLREAPPSIDSPPTTQQSRVNAAVPLTRAAWGKSRYHNNYRHHRDRTCNTFDRSSKMARSRSSSTLVRSNAAFSSFSRATSALFSRAAWRSVSTSAFRRSFSFARCSLAATHTRARKEDGIMSDSPSSYAGGGVRRTYWLPSRPSAFVRAAAVPRCLRSVPPQLRAPQSSAGALRGDGENQERKQRISERGLLALRQTPIHTHT